MKLKPFFTLFSNSYGMHTRTKCFSFDKKPHDLPTQIGIKEKPRPHIINGVPRLTKGI